MPINFNLIPADIRTPGQYIEFDSSRAQQGLPLQPKRILVLGQKLAAGSAPANGPVLLTGAAQAEGLFGRGSMLAMMVRFLKAANAFTEAWGLPVVEPAAGAAAAGALAVTGPATAEGTLYLYIGGQRLQVGVHSADTATAIAAAIVAAVNAQTDLPVTALVDGVDPTKADLTCRWKGLTGNDMDVRCNYQQGEAFPAGVAVAVTALSGGTGEPDLTAAIAAMGDVPYTTVIVPWTDATTLADVEAELVRRWGPMVMQDGLAFAAVKGTVGALTTFGTALNSQLLTVLGTGSSPTPPYLWAAVAGAVDEAEPDPARPRQTLPLPGLLAPAVSDQFIREERDTLLHDGISTFTVDQGGAVLIERLITTYQQAPGGIPDTSYLDVTTLRTLAYIRYSVRARIALKFPRCKLADDGTRFGAGQAVVTPNTIRLELIALFGEWEDAGLVQNASQFAADLAVERDGSDVNRVNALIPPDLINQLMVFAGQVQFLL